MGNCASSCGPCLEKVAGCAKPENVKLTVDEIGTMINAINQKDWQKAVMYLSVYWDTYNNYNSADKKTIDELATRVKNSSVVPAT